MLTAWTVSAGLVALGVAALAWAGARWLTRSWELLDDDQLAEKLAGPATRQSSLWLRVRGWFTGPRRLTYRRDARGRFRRIRR